MITYNIKDLYDNIPIEETLTITKSLLLKSNDTQTMQQIIALIRLVLSNNYFTFQDKIYQPEKVVSMGSPVSSIITKIFLQYFEDIHITQLLDTKHNIPHTLHRQHFNYIWQQKNTPWYYSYIHIPDRHKHKAQSYIWKQRMNKFRWPIHNPKAI